MAERTFLDMMNQVYGYGSKGEFSPKKPDVFGRQPVTPRQIQEVIEEARLKSEKDTTNETSNSSKIG